MLSKKQLKVCAYSTLVEIWVALYWKFEQGAKLIIRYFSVSRMVCQNTHNVIHVSASVRNQAFIKYPSDVYHLLASRVQRRDHVPSLSLCGAICMANLGEYCHSFAYDITTHKCIISEDLVFTNDEGLAELQTSLSPNHLLYSNGKVCQRTNFFAVIMNCFEKYFIFPS